MNQRKTLIEQRIHTANIDVLCSKYYVLNEWHFGGLSDPYWKLYWNHKEGARVSYKEGHFPIGPDHLVLAAPNASITSSMDDGGIPHKEANGSDYHVFSKDNKDELLRNPKAVCHFFTHFVAGQPYDSVEDGVFRIDLGSGMKNLVKSLIDSFDGDRSSFNHRDSFRLHAIINYALSQVPTDMWPQEQADSRIVKVTEYIDKTLGKQLTNEDFAHMSSMSSNAFTRLFKEKTGLTPLEHLKLKRLEKASIMLHHTEHSIEHIAESCGFCDRNYFTRIFQSKYTVGPATYRKTRPM